VLEGVVIRWEGWKASEGRRMDFLTPEGNGEVSDDVTATVQ
jgi:hypothetical protein